MSPMKLKLYCANKRYSSWTLRVWVVLEHFGIPYTDEVIYLRKPDSGARIDHVVKGAKLPILVDGTLRIWESIAILEYLAEKYPKKALWPANRTDRALARAYASEMHAGFMGLRMNCPMNCFAKPFKAVPQAAMSDIARIGEIWHSCLKAKKPGGFLFGRFTIADAMFAPVVIRLKTYGVPMDKTLSTYMDRVLALPAMRKWFAEAALEKERIADYENIGG